MHYSNIAEKKIKTKINLGTLHWGMGEIPLSFSSGNKV